MDWFVKVCFRITRVLLVLEFMIAGNKLSDFYIRVGNSFNQASFDPTSHTLCWHQPCALGAGETRQFTCNQVLDSRYVIIHFSSGKIEQLILCEVKVYSDLGKTLEVIANKIDNIPKAK